MSQLFCLECGNEISDNAKNCKVCGVPLQIDGLACPKCSSKMLHTEKISFSDDMAAIVSWVFAGGMGLSTKVKDKQDISIICLKCNYKFKVDEAKNIMPEPQVPNDYEALQ